MPDPSRPGSSASGDKIAVLSELKRLLDAGALTEREFAAMKGVVLEGTPQSAALHRDGPASRVADTSDDRAMIMEALAGMGDLEAVTQIARRFEIFELPAGSRVVPNGLGILLRGRCSLELDGALLAEVPTLGYFHEERLISDALRDRLALVARDDARIAILDREVWASSSVEYRHPFG